MNNDAAEMHYLTKEESEFFELHVSLVNRRILQMINDNSLKGSWTLSDDFKWLVKIEE